MKVAYVAGKYRDKTIYGIKKNIDKAESLAMALWTAGFAVICPHKNTAFFDGACPDRVWLAGDLELLRRCDFVVMVNGWESSTGARAEREEAMSLGIPVYTKLREAIITERL